MTTIVKQIFNNTRQPATGWVSPVVDGYKANQCGEYCVFDAAKAKAKLDEAGGFKGGKMTIAYNADASHKAWVEATCNSIKGALGVDCVATPVVDFATFRSQITDRKMKGMFRSGWQMDYPSIENFLAPIYKTGASSNDGRVQQPRVRQAHQRGCCPDGRRPRPTPSTRRLRRCSPATCRPSRCGTPPRSSAGPTRSPASRSRHSARSTSPASR